MQTAEAIKTELKKAFTVKQAAVLSKVIVEAHDDLVKADDFNELKDIVKELGIKVGELAEAQKGSEKRLTRVEAAVEELAEAQKETQKELKALAEKTKLLAEETKTLTKGLNLTRKDLGGVTSTLGYMLENEAYRILPETLKNRYGIEVTERFLRRSIRSFGIDKDGDVNIFSRGRQKGKEIVIIGEAKSKLEKEDIDQIIEISDSLKEVHKGDKFLLAVTHYAREGVIEYAKENGVEVIQSFEW